MNRRRWGSFYEGQKLKAWSSDVFQHLRHTVWPIQNGPHNKTNSFDNEINMSNSCVQSDWSVTSFNIFTINICLELDMLTNREAKSMTRWEIEPKDFCIVTFSSHFTKFQLYSLKEKCSDLPTNQKLQFTLKVLSKTCILPSSLVTSFFFEQQPNNPIIYQP